MANVCIIDYGSGNTRSVYNIFRNVCEDVRISSSPEDIQHATHLVLPGVGAFGATMEKIKALSFMDCLNENVLEKKKPFLGICVGMQILADEGHENGTFAGLGWIPGTVRKLNSSGHRLPHVGWNNLKIIRSDSLVKDLTDETDFYYVHSYCFETTRPEHVTALCEYGELFPSIIRRDNIFGVQFHPEKSQKAGLALIKNFMSIS